MTSFPVTGIQKFYNLFFSPKKGNIDPKIAIDFTGFQLIQNT